MKKAITLFALVAVVGLFVLAPKPAEARLQYMKEFLKKYEKIEEAKMLKCGICHGDKGKNKKVKSDYAKALGKGLGKKNQKDMEIIGKAFEGAAKAKSGDGTFGDLLKDGKLPPPAKAE